MAAESGQTDSSHGANAMQSFTISHWHMMVLMAPSESFTISHDAMESANLKISITDSLALGPLAHLLDLLSMPPWSSQV
jgi:hypothetical protein